MECFSTAWRESSIRCLRPPDRCTSLRLGNDATNPDGVARGLRQVSLEQFAMVCDRQRDILSQGVGWKVKTSVWTIRWRMRNTYNYLLLLLLLLGITA